MLHLDSLRRYGRVVKRAGRLLTGRDVLYRYDARPKKLLLGTLYGGWTIAPEYLDSTSVMYSFGVGNDISFDLAAIDKFGMQVHGFDPSPQAVAWMTNQRLPPQYAFHSYGLGTQDGAVSFFAPGRNTGMYSVNSHHRGVTGTNVALPVHTLATIVKSLNTRKIDVLKMDIEGAEYDLITSIVECSVPIRQLLIEFHHRIGVAPLKTTIKCVEQLKSAGFKLFNVSSTSSEFSFLRE